jgi:hypothetical protein
MATMAMAMGVLEHANQYYDLGGWYVIAECWDAWAVLEELDRQEAATNRPFELEAGAIGHFAAMIPHPATGRS